MTTDVEMLLTQVRDAMTVKRVYGDPIERNGLTVIPVANVMGGFGGGGGEGTGRGGGFGVRVTPAGVYVIDNGRVRWEPALNLNQVILGGQLTAIALFLTLRALAKTLARRRGRDSGWLPSLRLPLVRTAYRGR